MGATQTTMAAMRATPILPRWRQHGGARDSQGFMCDHSPWPQASGLKTTLGARASAGETLLVIEAMKMEIAIQTEQAGTIVELRCKRGQAVAGGRDTRGFEDF